MDRSMQLGGGIGTLGMPGTGGIGDPIAIADWYCHLLQRGTSLSILLRCCVSHDPKLNLSKTHHRSQILPC